MNHKENETYEMIPDDEGDAWHIRILDGTFVESVNHFINFDFQLISSPDPDVTVDNIDLQETAGDILHNIMVTSLENKDGSVAIKDKNEDEWEIIE